MAVFKKVEFAKGLKCSFADFKKMVKGMIDPQDYEDAYKVATGEDGKSKNTTAKSKSAKSNKAIKKTISEDQAD